jgi:hypothetical protein
LEEFLGDSKAKVAELKKAKQPFEEELQRMLKLKKIVGDTAPPAPQPAKKKKRKREYML